jgi:hypothetical protein
MASTPSHPPASTLKSRVRSGPHIDQGQVRMSVDVAPKKKLKNSTKI